ncbi:MAG: phosphatidate cytidylyltransferase [Deltaproteobacteria bacterium]|nr:phosphatidate cytidylyltransferase [Deltaproteobacteria bacterium]
MSLRVKTGLILLAVFLVVLSFGGPGVFALAVAVLGAVGAREYHSLAAPGANPLEAAFTPLWAAAVILSFLGRSGGATSAVLALGAAAYFAAWITGPGPRPDMFERWAASLGAAVVIGVFLGHAVWVRGHGIAPVLFLCLVVWAGDTAAYYAGTAFGTHRLAPAVSPKKSVEGAVASVAASAAIGALLGATLPLPHSAAVSLVLGIVLNVAAQLGDLAESLWKRCAGVKDSGHLFPGHGGVLDRMDGFLLALPLYAAYLRLTVG